MALLLKRTVIITIVSSLLMFMACAREKHGRMEKDYQMFWCDKNHGVQEYRLNDNTRVDCLTDDYAVEFDFGHKWAEAAGQALYYGLKTGRKPGVVLILNESAEERYYKRLKLLSDEYKIKLWKMKPSDLD